jgi:hypothetical protein
MPNLLFAAQPWVSREEKEDDDDDDDEEEEDLNMDS